jgi:hypothetical protein
MEYNQVKKMYEDKGHKFFTEKYALNIFGERVLNQSINKFNDIIGVAYIDEFGNGKCLTFKGTTVPGLSWLKEKMGTAAGTFILKEGQYLNCWTVRPHNGKYDCLGQVNKKVFIGYRDSDKDGQLDLTGKEYDDVMGLNLHTTSFNSNTELVGLYSAGCQVIQDDKNFLILMAIVNKAREVWNANNFSYTLFNK